MNKWVDFAEATISLGVRERACRLNGDGKNFDKAAENLAHVGGIFISGETLRKLVEHEGRRVLELQRSGELSAGFAASDCKTDSGPSRVYFGCDGVMVPTITDAEKQLRREKIKQERRRRGRRARPLPPARK